MKRWLIITLSIVIFAAFSTFINKDVNYPEHVDAKYFIIHHPEFIPSAQTVRIGSAGHDLLTGDIAWIDAIQYVGSNARSEAYKVYLFKLLDLITDIEPRFTFAYTFGELLLGSDTHSATTDDGRMNAIQHNKDALKLGLKGLQNTCDMQKIDTIRTEPNINMIVNNPKYQNPCTDYQIPYYLGYIEYWGFLDGKDASDYYRITAANQDAPDGARVLAAIMQGKGGDREKSATMFRALAESMS